MKHTVLILAFVMFVTVSIKAQAASQCDNAKAEDLLKSLQSVNANFGSEDFFACLAPRIGADQNFLMFSAVVFDIITNDKDFPAFFTGHNLPRELPSGDEKEWHDYYKNVQHPAQLYKDLYAEKQKLESESSYAHCEDHKLSLESERQGFIYMMCEDQSGHKARLAYQIQHEDEGWYILGSVK